ncbi:hypothetical protein MLD38_030757 [Melastoma candidum]|uniref:Uncharacterized protein n=1 Tax=Melastoma candidum TaxID=119954 RepID=A0ACB9MM37_9MYRT|nr:hypothetical protein MLD38_030757 [Melastoma candidum]
MGGASTKCIKGLIPHKKPHPTDYPEKGKKPMKWRLWRSASEESSLNEKAVMKGRYVAAASEASESATYALNDLALAAAVATIIRAPPKNFTAIKQEWAAVRLQTAFRAFLARRALRALKAVVRIQAIFRGRQVRKQAAVTLKCMQALVRVQARVRAHSVRMLEGEETGNLFGEKSDFVNPLKQAECGWCDSPGTLDEVKSKLELRQKAVVKRERAMAYSLSQQYARGSASPMRICTPTNSLKSQGPDKANMGWSWLDRWMASKPSNDWLDESCRSDPDLMKVRRSSITNRVSARPPATVQMTSSSSDPISGSLYGEGSTSTSSTSASLTPVSRLLLVGERTEESKLQKPSYMNLTESAKAKQARRLLLCQDAISGQQAVEATQFCARSMALSARETRSVSGSTPSVNFSKDLYPPTEELDKQGWSKMLY